MAKGFCKRQREELRAFADKSGLQRNRLMENNKSFLELKWGYFFDLMDYDKNGRWDLRDFVSFSEKLYILYEVNHIDLDVFQFMKKSRNIFNRLLSEVTKELRYIKKEDWISFLHKTEEYSGKRYFNLLIYSISRELFDVSDQNKDGYLSELELLEIYDILGIDKDTAKEAMKFLDLDNDHRISKAELHQGLYDFFTNPEEKFTLFGDMRLSQGQLT